MCWLGVVLVKVWGDVKEMADLQVILVATHQEETVLVPSLQSFIIYGNVFNELRLSLTVGNRVESAHYYSFEMRCDALVFWV